MACEELGIDSFMQDFKFEATDEMGDRFFIIPDPQSKRRTEEKVIWEVFSVQDSLVEITKDFGQQTTPPQASGLNALSQNTANWDTQFS